MSVPTFVVGTGRCGSTMLSNMLRQHPRVLSLSEFFGFVTEGRVTEPFAREPIDGRKFWEIVADISSLARFCSQHRIVVPEAIYPRGSPAARYSFETGVPGILVTTLPHLTDDHDHLFDQLRDEVSTWPIAAIGEHYRHLFKWLTDHFDKRLWVERSGTSLLLTEHLLSTFPEARFIHITRDGRDAAISMHQHLGLRLVVGMNSVRQYLGVDPLESSDRANLDRVPEELRPFLPEWFDANALGAFQLPLPLCGDFWSQQISTGMKALAALPADRLLTLRYEDFFIDPRRQLDDFTAFLGEEFVDIEWSAHGAATVRVPRSTWRDLPEEDAHALTEACRPGFELLREAGVEYSL
jgi:putative sulfotransferase